MCYPASKLSDNVISFICFPVGKIKYFFASNQWKQKTNPRLQKAHPHTPLCYNNQDRSFQLEEGRIEAGITADAVQEESFFGPFASIW